MDLGIAGRAALLAGASAGLGRAAALALAAEGARLFISAPGEARLRAAAEEIRKASGADVRPVVADHGSEAGARGCGRPAVRLTSSSSPSHHRR